MQFQDLDRIVFAGDSVTDMGSVTPVGEGLFDNLGHGYVRMIENMLSAFYPEVRIRVTNSGIGGHTSQDLLDRWERDVLSLKPDYISICIGINDVWRQFDSPAMPDYAVTPEQYRENLTKMVESAKDRVKGIYMMSPYYMEPNTMDPMRKRMDEYSAIVREVAETYGCTFIDLQAMFDRYFRHRHSSFIAWDRIHPNEKGATLIAKEFLAHCGFDFSHIPE